MGAALLFATATSAVGQPAGPDEEAWRISVGGVLLGRLSYGAALDSSGAEPLRRLGFGIRQAQMQGRAVLGDHVGVVGSLNLGTGTASVQSLFVFYELAPSVRLRLGRIPTPKPVGTPLTLMDDVDRSATEILWSARTVGGHGHDFGLEARLHSDHAEAVLLVHNGDGDWSGLRGDYTSFIHSGGATSGIRRLGMAASGSLVLRPRSTPGLEVAAFAGANGSRNPNTERDGIGRRYTTAGGHLHWGAAPGSQPVRFKLDVSSLRYASHGAAPSGHHVGIGLFGAARLGRGAEVFLRAEQDQDLRQPDSADRYVALGGSLSPSALRGRPYGEKRLTASWRTRLRSEGDTDHLAVLQLQLAF